MKFLFATLLFLLFFAGNLSAQRDSLLKVLKNEISNKEKYAESKLKKIQRIKTKLASKNGGSFVNLLSLFEEYEYYQFDSAYKYGVKLLELSSALQNKQRISISKVKISSLLLHAGMFKETFDLLKEIDPSLLSEDYRYDYYCLKSGAYSNLAIYNNNPNFTEIYNRRAVEYLDSALVLCKPNSFEELFTKGNRQVVAGEINKKPTYFLKILRDFPVTQHQRARVLTGLAAFYHNESQNEIRVSLLIESAIFDIRAAVRETLATLLLAEDLFSHGHLEDAYIFIQHSRADAEFYGNRLRKLKIESVYPEIASEINIQAQKDKNRLMIYFLSISSLAILILLVSFMIFIQLKKVRSKERIIEQKNIELESINTQLVYINDKLREYATVNEKYIGYFFEMVSGYILKLDRLKRSVERKMLAKRYSEILPTLNAVDIKTERALLFNTFDRVFISIFPNFIQAFNDLLKEEDQIWPKAPEVLNIDLRIFALIRLGINDIGAIATILQYSENTIYVYKMRIKAKSLVSSEEFDRSIMSVIAV